MQDWGSPTECYPAGGIRPLFHHTDLVCQRLADWAPGPPRDPLPIPATPSQATRGLCKTAESQSQGELWSGLHHCPLTRKFRLFLLVPPQALLDPFSKEKPCLFVGKLVSGLGGAESVVWGLRRGSGGRCFKAEGGRKSLKSHRLRRKKRHNHSHFGFVTPTVLQSGGGGDRSCSFIAVEERTRKMLTAFMCCGINNNRLGFIAFYSLLKSLQPFFWGPVTQPIPSTR